MDRKLAIPVQPLQTVKRLLVNINANLVLENICMYWNKISLCDIKKSSFKFFENLHMQHNVCCFVTVI